MKNAVFLALPIIKRTRRIRQYICIFFFRSHASSWFLKFCLLSPQSFADVSVSLELCGGPRFGWPANEWVFGKRLIQRQNTAVWVTGLGSRCLLQSFFWNLLNLSFKAKNDLNFFFYFYFFSAIIMYIWKLRKIRQ